MASNTGNTQKTVLITGCGAGGIGAALAKEFHRRGCAVIATGHTTAETDVELLELGKSNSAMDRGSAGSMHCFESKLESRKRCLS